MKKFLSILAAAVLGYAAYELLRRLLLEPEGGPSALQPMGRVKGAAMTAGGHGSVQLALGPDGSSTSERVGRGVVRRG